MKRPVFALAIVLLAALAQTSFAYYGARPMGMGGAFTAIADDANAAYWNPAGMALNPGVDITGSTNLTNRNVAMGENMFAAKFCYDAPMSSPFEWILGIGFLSSMALDTAQFLGDAGVLKKNWGRDVVRTKREDSMADQVKEGGSDVTASRDPFKRATPKPDKDRHVNRYWGPLNLNFNFYTHRRGYWRHGYYSDFEQPLNRAQFALGLTWLYDTNRTLDMNSNWYTVTLASGWEERIAVGGNINFYDLKIPSINIKGFGAGVDIGAIAKPLPNISLGLVAKEILTTDINWQNNTQTRYEMLVNGGVAIDPVDIVTIAVDGHNLFGQNSGQRTMHYGVEVRPFYGLALRGGLSDGNKTAGASVMVGPLVVDYAYLGGTYQKTQLISSTIKF